MENIVLGTLLLESTAIDRVAHFLRKEAFYNARNEAIYAAILQMYDGGDKIDMLTVCQKLLKTNPEYDDWILTVTGLTLGVASTAHLEHHAMLLHDKMIARRVILHCNVTESKAFEGSTDITEVANEGLRGFEEIATDTAFNSNEISIGQAALQSVQLYNNRKKLAESGVKSGIETGLKDLNFSTNGGWKPGQLIILAARPAMGKSALMLHFAKQAALSGTPVMIFSLEMDVQSLTNRMMLSVSEFDSFRFASGRLSHYEEESYYKSVDDMRALQITIDDTPNATIQQIKIKARNAKRKGLCGIVFIDYLQLVDMRHANKAYNREQEVAQTSRSAKIMAKELDVPVILLSQLSRNVEGRSSKRPLLSDLRESGAIEQDADIVMFIHRDEYYGDSDGDTKGKGTLIISKQRDGAVGDIIFRYNHNLTRITSYDAQKQLSSDAQIPF